MPDKRCRVAGIILAAGMGTRMGGPKALIQLNGETALLRLCRQMQNIGLDPILPVVNETVETELSEQLSAMGISTVLNEDLDLGPLHSIHLGLERIPDSTQAMMILPVDFPRIRSTTFSTLINAASEDRILLPTHGGRRGHPPVMGREFFDQVRGLDLDGGLRQLYREVADDQIVELAVDDPAIHWNVNTASDLERFKWI
ncbi:MAG TPA: nucleotidyltransferase family protein [Bacteroidetes bacterium]|nr:nucleotidyltransferase family protein [Bacteroidota bacterium]HEX04920.1 nucleotidyltransferase family protein [Bacteroidota bacterium]